MDTAKRARLYRRIQAVLLVAEGHPIQEAAERVRAHPRSVRRWIGSYLEDRDPAALDDAPRSGRPAAAAGLGAEHVSGVLATDPRTLGYASTTWTVPLLSRHLRGLGHRLSERTLRRRLHALGYRWKRPRYRYSSRPSRRERGAKKGL
jgi:transposase